MSRAPITAQTRPRLAPQVQLRFDRHAQQYMLLYPERGLTLNASAAEIAQLCTGENTLAEIVTKLTEAHAGAAPEQLARDVQAFVEALAARALIRFEAP
jgi:pyrroloquinoline quinone biosynthesis protein D